MNEINYLIISNTIDYSTDLICLQFQKRGLNYLRINKKKYDSILIDVENPEVAHSSNLYTVESFSLVASSLREDGTFALWNFGEALNQENQDIIFYSLKHVFPYVYEYHEVFLATFQKINKSEYVSNTEKQLNTIDHKLLIS